MPYAPVMQWKSWAVALLAIPLAAGCRQHLPPTPPPPFRGATLRVACPARASEFLRVQSRSWLARQQAQIAFIPIDRDEGESGAGVPVPDADVLVLLPAQLTRHAESGQLATLPEPLQARDNLFDWANLLPWYRQQLLVWRDRAYGLPLLGEAPVCVYRTDVKGLRAPLTWDDFATQAETASKQRPSGTSLPPLPASPAQLDRLFYQVATSFVRRAVRQDEREGKHPEEELFSFHFSHRTGEPLIGGPGFVEALKILQRLQRCRPEKPGDAAEAFLSGQAVLGVVEAGVLARLQGSPLRDRIGVCPVPGTSRYFSVAGQEVRLEGRVNRVPYLGGAGLLGAVPAASTQQEAAFDLLANLAGPARSNEAALEPRWGGGPIRGEQLLRDRWDAFGLDPARTRDLKETLSQTLSQHGLKNPVLCLRVPNEQAYRDVLVRTLQRVLPDRNADPDRALAEVAVEWRKLAGRKEAGTHRSLYRISLGLLGDR